MSEKETIKLQITNITTDETFETSEFTFNATVQDVKEEIFKQKAFAIDRQNLIFQGEKVTADTSTIEEIGVDKENFSFCLVVGRPPPTYLLKAHQNPKQKAEEEALNEIEPVKEIYEPEIILEKRVLNDFNAQPPGPTNWSEEDDEDFDPFSITSSLFSTITMGLTEGIKTVGDGLAKDFIDVKEGVKALVATDIDVSEEGKNLEELHAVLDGSLEETFSIANCIRDYRNFLHDQMLMERELINRLRACNSHLIFQSSAQQLANTLESQMEVTDNKRKLLGALVLEPIQTIAETQLEPAAQIRAIYKQSKKNFDHKNTEYRRLQTEIAELRDTDEPKQKVAEDDLFGFFGAVANFVQTAGEAESKDRLKELKAQESVTYENLQNSSANYELATKDFLKTMTNIDVKIATHLKPSFEGYGKAMQEVFKHQAQREELSTSERNSESGSEVLVNINQESLQNFKSNVSLP